MLDNKNAILFIRGERPLFDLKYDILKHPNLKLTTDGGNKAYMHGQVDNSIALINLELFNENTKSSKIEKIEDDYDIISSDDIDFYLEGKE